jgi:hypothetical protein
MLLFRNYLETELQKCWRTKFGLRPSGTRPPAPRGADTLQQTAKKTAQERNDSHPGPELWGETIFSRPRAECCPIAGTET